jgi:hypothetical protein
MDRTRFVIAIPFRRLLPAHQKSRSGVHRTAFKDDSRYGSATATQFRRPVMVACGHGNIAALAGAGGWPRIKAAARLRRNDNE